MQDLFLLGPGPAKGAGPAKGLGPANQPEAGTPTRAGRTRDRSADSDMPSTAVNFNLLLAMAAFPTQTEQPPAIGAGVTSSPETGDVGTVAAVSEAQVTPTRAVDQAMPPVAIEQAPRFTTWRARLDALDGPTASEEQAMPTDARREQWGARIHNLFESIVEERPQATAAPARDSAAQRAPKVLTIEGGHQPAGGESAQLESAQIDAPNLKIVARNDQPAAQSAPTQPANLRLIHPDGSVTFARPNQDLLARLADGWRQSFADDDIQLPDNAPDAAAPHGIDEALQGDTEPGNAEFEVSTLRLLDARGGEREPGTDQQADQPGERPDVPRAGKDAGRTATIVPLFGDLTVAGTPRSGGQPEGAVGVRRAVVEIAGEALRLEQTGGSELSFSLKLAPEHLGQIEIDIQRVDDRWSISITTSGDAARDALAAEIHRLERSLREHNLALDGVSVVTRGAEPALDAPRAADQTHNPDWFGGQARDFGGSRNWDESGWRAASRNEIIGIDFSPAIGAEQEVTAGHTSAPRSGIDIQA